MSAAAQIPQTHDLVDARHLAPHRNEIWPAHLVQGAGIARAVAALTEGGAGLDGRREVLAVHPSSKAPVLGLAPSTAVSFGVLLPGERTRLRRRNATSFTMGLGGSAVVRVGARELSVGLRDSWNTPGMHAEQLENRGDQPFTYVSYSNAPLLQRLEVLFEELDPKTSGGVSGGGERGAGTGARAKDVAGQAIPLGDDGSMLLPYEHLVDPDFVDSRPLLWRWEDVKPHLGLVRALKQGYTGRPLWCLYNPATGTRNGTTSSFFATIASAGPNIVGPAHRHVSSAINFILEGSGFSIVDGVRLEWAAGDIMLSAPGWSPHGHGMGPDGALILTVQDHPLHIGAESLIWQEDLKDGPILTLGAERGFETNLRQMRGEDAR